MLAEAYPCYTTESIFEEMYSFLWEHKDMVSHLVLDANNEAKTNIIQKAFFVLSRDPRGPVWSREVACFNFTIMHYVQQRILQTIKINLGLPSSPIPTVFPNRGSLTS